MPSSRPILAYADLPLYFYEVALENIDRQLTDRQRRRIPDCLYASPYAVCFARLWWWN